MYSPSADIPKRLQGGSPFPLIEAVDESLYSHQYLALSICFHFNSLLQFDFLDDQLNILSHIYYHWMSFSAKFLFKIFFPPLIFLLGALSLRLGALYVFYIFQILVYCRIFVCVCIFLHLFLCFLLAVLGGHQLWHSGSSFLRTGLSQLQHVSSRARDCSSGGRWTQLACGTWDISSLTKDPTSVLCMGSQICNHWITKEVPLLDIRILMLSLYFLFSPVLQVSKQVPKRVSGYPKMWQHSLSPCVHSYTPP